MKEIPARLHMHNHKTPDGRAYIIGDRAGLRQLGEALVRTSKSVAGFETVKLYTSDGHSFQILVTCSVGEDEWQTLPVPYSPNHNPEILDIVKSIDEYNRTKMIAKQ